MSSGENEEREDVLSTGKFDKEDDMGKDTLNGEQQTEKLPPPTSLPLFDNITADNLHMLPTAQYWSRPIPVSQASQEDTINIPTSDNKTSIPAKKPAVSLQLKKTPSPSSHSPSSAFSGMKNK